jgi:hydrogenase large subunit
VSQEDLGMSSSIIYGPITRIEGHMDIEVTIDAVDGVQKVVDARCAGTMFRGVEMLLQGRHPRDAVHITSRVCGVCPTSHALAASMALESAYGARATPPDNGRILRNLILGADFLQSHILHFYQLALLDYVDGVGVLDMAPWTPRQPAPDLIAGPNGEKLLAHYMEAMNVRRKIGQMGAIFGGTMPCSPVFLPGGCTPILTDVADIATMGEPNASETIKLFRALLDEVRCFILTAYLPDVQLLVEHFPEYSRIGRGPANLLAFGAFDLDPNAEKRLLKRGVYADGRCSALDVAHITESVAYAWYADSRSDLAAGQGIAWPDLEKTGAYSWIKAPRYQGQAFEVGPLARMWISGFYRQGVSVMDRLVARALETQKIADAMVEWVQELKVESPARSRFKYPSSGNGAGLSEAPRGALGHWVEFSRQAIRRYQILTPTGWNASPRDETGQKGPMEQALIGTPVRDKNQPIELLRVVHSFDPCLACSVH